MDKKITQKQSTTKYDMKNRPLIVLPDTLGNEWYDMSNTKGKAEFEEMKNKKEK